MRTVAGASTSIECCSVAVAVGVDASTPAACTAGARQLGSGPGCWEGGRQPEKQAHARQPALQGLLPQRACSAPAARCGGCGAQGLRARRSPSAQAGSPGRDASDTRAMRSTTLSSCNWSVLMSW
jgi:hypothetical protein